MAHDTWAASSDVTTQANKPSEDKKTDVKTAKMIMMAPLSLVQLQSRPKGLFVP
jgi:hypothetical protein